MVAAKNRVNSWSGVSYVSSSIVREPAPPEYAAPVSDSTAAARVLRGYIGSKDQEHSAVLLLNARNVVTGIQLVSVGTVNQCTVHPRDVFRLAVAGNCARIIVAHNHPSGDPSPSPEDITLTRRLVEAGELLGVEVLDHIIVTDGERFHSFRDAAGSGWAGFGLRKF